MEIIVSNKTEYSKLLLQCYHSGQMSALQYKKHLDAGEIIDELSPEQQRIAELKEDVKFLLSFSPCYKSVEDKVADIKKRLEQ
jgi:hypothetical protein